MKIFISLILLFSYLISAFSSSSPYQSSQCNAIQIAEENYKIAKQYQETKKEFDSSPDIQYRGLDTYTVYYLRSSARLAPLNPLYWNELAVFEKAIGQYLSALEHYDRALYLDEKFELAQKNREEFFKFLEEKGYDTKQFEKKWSQYKRKHKIEKIPEYSRDSFQNFLKFEENEETEETGKIEEGKEKKLKKKLQEFVNFYSNNSKIFSKPFIIKNYLKSSKKKILNFFHPKNLISQYSDAHVDFYPQGLKNKDTSTAQLIPLKDAISYFYCPKTVYSDRDVSKRRGYIQWNLNEKIFQELLIKNDIEIPFFFQDDYLFQQCFEEENDIDRFFLLTHWKMLLIGEGEGNPYDIQENLNALNISNELFKIRKECRNSISEISSSIGVDGNILKDQEENIINNMCKFEEPGFEYDEIKVGRGGPFDEGAGMFFHRDALRVPSFQLQLYGKKLWHLCPGEVSQKLKRRKTDSNSNIEEKKDFPYTEDIFYMDTSSDNFHEEEDGTNLNLFSPDYTDYPLFLDAECYEALVSPGDLVYYPQGYYHQTHCPGKDPCVSLSSSLNQPHTLPRLIGELMRECKQTIDIRTKEFSDSNLSESFVESFYSFFLNHAMPNEHASNSSAFSYIPPPPLNGVRFFPDQEPICKKLLKCYEEWWSLFEDYQKKN